MTAIPAVTSIETPAARAVWGPFTESDTPAATAIKSGRYTFTAEGTWGGLSLELQFSKGGTTFHSIDATNLTYTADKSYNVELGHGFLKPIVTGGSGASLKAYLDPIN